MYFGYSKLLAGAVFSLQLLSPSSSSSSFSADTTAQFPLHSPARPHRVAIIGGGAGGSSAAYYLDEFSKASKVPLEITIFDSNARIGGRTTTVNALDDPRYPTELGASIFVKINHILYNATERFGLTPSQKIYQSVPDSNYDLGIWDGKQFVFKVARDDDSSSWRGWWDIAKLLWKYGWSPIRVQQASKAAVKAFLNFYEEPFFPFRSLQETVEASGLDSYTGISGTATLQKARVSELFSREIIQASTRVNYASNLGGIHGLETLVCMAIEGAVAVDGGNWQIFEQMIQTAAPDLFLNTTVTDVTKDADKGMFHLKTTDAPLNQRLASSEGYDSVILAAPYQFANVSFTPPLVRTPTEIPYVTLHVTLLASRHRLSPLFFDQDSQADVPSSVLTTLSPELTEELGPRRGVHAVGPPGFWSISTLGVLHPRKNTDDDEPPPASSNSCNTTTQDETQYLYKIFSPAPLKASFITRLLDFPYTPSAAEDLDSEEDSDSDSLAILPKEHISWFHEKKWHSYPYEQPTTQFDDFELHMSSDSQSQSDANLKSDGRNHGGIWYLSSIEPFISTMETSALAGMNVARLIVDRLSTATSARCVTEPLS